MQLFNVVLKIFLCRNYYTVEHHTLMIMKSKFPNCLRWTGPVIIVHWESSAFSFELAAKLRWFTAGGAIRLAVRQLSQTWKLHHYDVIDDVISRKLWETDKNGDHIAAWNPVSYTMVKTASLYDNFCKTGNNVTDDVIIWVQDGNCKKMARENFSTGALYNITKNQDNPINTVGRDSFWAQNP